MALLMASRRARRWRVDQTVDTVNAPGPSAPPALGGSARPELAVVIVNYLSGNDLRDCLGALVSHADGIDLEVVVVDNGSEDGSLDGIERICPSRVVTSGADVGFGAGVNRGVAATSAPWILVVNPDARIVEGELRAFVDAAEARPEVALFGPRILRDDGSPSVSQARFPTLGREFAEAIRLHHVPGLSGVQRAITNRSRYEHETRPDWVFGAVMLFRRDVFAAVGGFDDEYFLYWEEVDWCLRARRAGWEIAYLPTATFEHTGGAVRDKPELFATYVASNLRFYDKHYSRRRALAHRSVLILNLRLRLAAARVGFCAGRDAALERAIFASALAECRSGGVALRRPPTASA